MDIHFFPTPKDFRNWLRKNHAKEKELLVGFHKKDTGKPSITWPESVDEALCFGWIGGVRKSLGAESYVIRSWARKARGRRRSSRRRSGGGGRGSARRRRRLAAPSGRRGRSSRRSRRRTGS